MKSSFQAGVDAIYNAIVGQGVTPAGKTPAQLVTAVEQISSLPGNNAGAPIYQGAACPAWGERNGHKSISYTFTKDYKTVMLYTVGADSDYGLSSSEDQVKNSIWCNLAPNVPGVSWSGGTLVKQNGYYLLKNVKAGTVVTASYSPGGTRQTAVMIVLWEI